MKRIVIVALCLLLTLCTAVAFAASRDESTSGTTNGGTLGKTTCSGILTWTNNTSAGTDGAKATTKSDAAGAKKAYAYIYFTNQYGNSSASTSATSDGSNDAVTKKATASANGHGYRATSSHSYSSTNYGSWSGSCSHTFGSGDF